MSRFTNLLRSLHLESLLEMLETFLPHFPFINYQSPFCCILMYCSVINRKKNSSHSSDFVVRTVTISCNENLNCKIESSMERLLRVQNCRILWSKLSWYFMTQRLFWSVKRRSCAQITVGIYSEVVFDHLPLSQTIQNNYFQGSSTMLHSEHTVIFNIQGLEPPLLLMPLPHF